MIRRHQPFAPQARQRAEQRGQRFGAVEVGRNGTEALVRERERGAAQAVRAESQIDQQQRRFADVGTQHRHQAQACILDRCERRDDERQRRDDPADARVVAPGGAHGQRILSHRNREAERRAQLHRHRLHRIEQVRVLAGLATGGHPVRRQHHPIDARDVGRDDVRERLRHRHPGCRTRIEQRQRRALPHGDRFPCESMESAQRDRAVGDRHLPRTHHLVAGDEPADGAIADGHQERLVGHRGHAQHPLQCLADVDSTRVERPANGGKPSRVAMHSREIAEQGRHRHGDRRGVESGVVHLQMPVPRRFSDLRPRTALALAQRGELGDAARVDGEDVALLGLVAPDLERRHSGIVAGNGPQLDPSAPSGAVDQFGKCVGQPPGADVVNGENRIVGAELPAPVDDLLAAALHLRVLALHRREIERFLAAPRRARRRGAATETDEHRRSPQHDESGARGNGSLVNLVRTDVADPSRDHDGLVVAVVPCTGSATPIAVLTTGVFHRGRAAAVAAPVSDPRDVDFQGPEVSTQGRAPELVVEGGGTNGAVEHDRERGSDVRRTAAVVLPGLDEARDTQARDGEAGDARLAAGTASGRRLVPDLAAGAGGGAGEGRDCGRVVVGFHLHHDFHPPGHRRVPSGDPLRNEPARRMTARHGRVVAVCGEHIARVARVRVSNHVEQRPFVRHAVDRPGCIEDLVAAVLGVHLSEHHELRIGRIPAEIAEAGAKEFDLRGIQRKSERGVRVFKGSARVGAEFDRRVRRRCPIMEYRPESGIRARFGREERARRKCTLGHAIVKQARVGEESRRVAGIAARLRDRPGDAAFDARNICEAAAASDVRGLARPRRDRARTWRHDDGGARQRAHPVRSEERGVEEMLEPLDDPRRGVGAAYEVDPAPIQIGDRGRARPDPLHQALAPELRQGARSLKQQDGANGRGRSIHLAGAMIPESHPIDGAVFQSGR